jgi:hypothetical protein
LVACGSRTELDVPAFIDASICPSATIVTCTPGVLVSGVTAHDLVLDDRFVYFATDAGVSRVSKTGGTVAKLDDHASSYMTIAGGDVFFSTSGAIRHVTTSCDAPPSDLFSSQLVAPAALAADAQYVYAVDWHTSAVWKIARTGGAATKLHDYDKAMRLLAWNGLVLVSEWSDGIFLLSSDGTEMATYGGQRNDFMAESDGGLFSPDWSQIKFASLVEKYDYANIADTTTAAGIAADVENVYWADASGIWRAARPPAKKLELLEAASGALLVAVDGACVYYATNDRIVRTAK